jgi:DnaK suppressor protein
VEQPGLPAAEYLAPFIGKQMFVSLLQLMGFGLAKPIQSRAESNSDFEEVAASLNRSVSLADAGPVAPAGPFDLRGPEPDQTAPSRRSEVNTHPVSTVKTPLLDDASTPTPSKDVKAKAAQPKAPKVAAKPTANSSLSKGSEPAAAKPGAKVAPKQARPAGNAAAKEATPATAKTGVKSAAQAKDLAHGTKSSATPVAAKGVAKPSAKAVNVQPSQVKPQKKEIQPLSNLTPPTEKNAIKPESEMNPASTAVPAQGAVPARSGRVSSRLAQLTVPSMSATPAVASTAAKASYGQSTLSALPTPPHYVPVKKDAKLANNWKTKPVAQWSDEELVAMPDAEYMNEGQLAFFRLKLTQLKRDILASAGETTEHLREETVVVPDPADRATIEEEHALELRTRDRERKLLKKIEQSIARIDAGDYGYCDETGEAIGVSRLLARPTATLSLEAQQRRELKQKMFGE